MSPTFVYSLDRETWEGPFASRKEALAAAVGAAHVQPDSVGTVFVGQQLAPDVHAFGHARGVLDIIRRKVREDLGDAASHFLRRVPEEKVTELDAAIETVVVTWLEKHHLAPKSGKVEAISEHLVPTPKARNGQSHAGEPREREVSDLGVEGYSV